MYTKPYPIVLIIMALLILQVPAFAQQCAITRTGLNLCDGNQTAWLTNTPNSITIHDPGRFPTSGTYNVTISYYKQSTSTCQPIISCSGASVTSSGSIVTISLGSCTTLPANFSSEGIIYINLTAGPAGANYFFHIYGGACILPLPIHISTWDVQRIQTSSQYAIKVTWTADIEDNASHVIIERNSVAGQYEFEFEIGRVDVDHSSSPPHSYEFIDWYPLNGTNWYRLKLVDLDGSVEYITPKSESCSGCQYSAPWIDCSSYSIVGPSYFCSGTAEFTESNHLFYNKTTWSTDNGLVGYSPSTGPSTVLTQYGRGNTLLAMSQSRCSPATRTRYKSIEVGPPPVTGQFASSTGTGGYDELIRDGGGTNYVYPGNVWVWPNFNGNNPTWTMLWGNVTTWDVTGTTLHFVMPQHGDVTFQIDFNTEHCGMASEMFTFMDGVWSLTGYYSLSPNPATSQLSLSVDDRKLDKLKIKPSSEQAIQQVVILDKSGNLVMQQKYGPNTRNVSLNIGLLRQDVYTVRIYNGKKWTSIKFIKQ